MSKYDLSCFKQFPVNFTLTLFGGLIISSDNPLDFHYEITSIANLFKISVY